MIRHRVVQVNDECIEGDPCHVLTDTCNDEESIACYPSDKYGGYIADEYKLRFITMVQLRWNM
ncbi:hypothetical protein [Acinetobacter sp. ANC 4558]|uniref:hypothetical protein n=1 Tax=Acinetobacter sp. ANC 4558 TaxID=1977876 RepID=UPI00111C7480|nr:hypothetical protein [Acinetobacter sp. ANC 4558]